MPTAPFPSVFLLVLALTPAAFGQGVPNAPEADGWVAMVISIVLIVAVLVASFMSSKRGHQD